MIAGEKKGVERMLYSPILEKDIPGVEDFEPESFVPMNGTVLVILPPRIEKVGRIDLPERSFEARGVARVVAVPEDEGCPVKPGNWVVFVPDSPVPIKLGDRSDLALLHYTRDMDSDIRGVLTRSRKC